MTIIASDIDAAIGNDGFDTSADDQFVTVEAGVSVAANGQYEAIALGSQGDWLQNDGSLNATTGVGVNGASDYVWNTASGVISGRLAVGLDGADSELLNEGAIAASYNGVTVSESDASIVNRGLIHGQNDGIFVLLTPGAKILNTGVLSGTANALESQGSAVSLSNTGEIDGRVSITGGTIVNRGLIFGSVQFAGGANSFNGRGGSVTGSVLGGTGVDTLIAGNDGETLGGGGGHDKLTGGSGADTFVFSSFAAADSDVVNGFNSAKDVIEFAHSVFTTLAAGKTPVFAIGTTASGPTDHLFYNSSTGKLFYDTDGNGLSARHLIATLATGLHLTAHDFIVV